MIEAFLPNEPKTMHVILVTACSAACIGLGIWIFVRNR